MDWFLSFNDLLEDVISNFTINKVFFCSFENDRNDLSIFADWKLKIGRTVLNIEIRTNRSKIPIDRIFGYVFFSAFASLSQSGYVAYSDVDRVPSLHLSSDLVRVCEINRDSFGDRYTTMGRRTGLRKMRK